MITARTATLIQSTDTDQKYEEIYKDNPADPGHMLYWGVDHDVGRSLTLPYLLEDNLVAYTDYNTAMDGVVQEDAPVGKVLSHFYQATEGTELRLNGVSLGGDPSATRAMEFFRKAISFYGYTEEIKQHAYFIFGQALHHVEDMSSPAHIHNDAHLTFDETEKDDYEGWFLPTQKRFNADLDTYFSPTTVRAVTNPWNNIWGTGNPASMVRFFYDRTTYHATLDYPTATLEPGYALPAVPTPLPNPATPTGELHEMFPCLDGSSNYDNTVDNCLHWVEDNLDVLAHWEINAVGEFQHQYNNGAHNDWWPLEMETNPGQVNSKQRPLSFGDRYYLEQMAHNQSDTNPIGTRQVRPAMIRTPFLDPNAALAANSDMLMEIRARNLLTPAVEYSAGFTQHWFDIANTPPYLKAVKALQEAQDSSVVATAYDARWEDNTFWRQDYYNQLETCRLGGLVCDRYWDHYDMVGSRRYVLDSLNLRHIHAAKDLRVELEFNEPVASISQIGFGRFDAMGNCLSSDTGCLDFTPPTDTSTPMYTSLIKQNSDKTWVFILPAASLQGINGKLPLTVRAQDKNNHNDGAGGTLGGDLDGTPGTPARRNTDYGGSNYNPRLNYFPWYKDLGAEPGTRDALYSYDPEDGDSNHVLLFDTVFPAAVIDVNTTLPN